MKDDHFEDLAMAVILGEATDAERSEVEAACAADERRAQQLSEMRQDYDVAENMILARAAVQDQGNHPPIPRDLLAQLLRQRSAMSEDLDEHPASPAWWRQRYAWLGLAAAACFVVVLLRQWPSIPTERDLHDEKSISANQASSRPDPHSGDLQKTSIGDGVAPTGTSRLLDPLLNWPAFSASGDVLTLTVEGVGEVVTVRDVQPPRDLAGLLAIAGEMPRAGATYHVSITPSEGGSGSHRWTFMLASDARFYSGPTTDGALLAAAGEAALSDPDTAWQYLLRLSAAERSSARAREIALSLRQAKRE